MTEVGMAETRPIELIEAELVDGARDMAECIRDIGRLEMARADRYESAVPHMLNGADEDRVLADSESMADEFRLLRMKEQELQMRMTRLWTEHTMRKEKKK